MKFSLAVLMTAIVLGATSAGAIAQEGVFNEPNVVGFTEDGPPVLLAPNTTLDYPDSRVMRRATLRIRRAQAGERLYFVRQRGITGTYDTGTGVLTLRGRARVPAYESALRSVWYEHTGDAPARRRTIVMSVTDARGTRSRPARTHVRVDAVNDAPVLGSTSGGLRYTQGSGPQVLAPGITVLDQDSRIGGATAAIGAGGAGLYSSEDRSEDRLAFNPVRGITGTYDSGTGVLTLTGRGSAADYQAALRSITYSNSSTDPSEPDRMVTIQLTDVHGEPSNSVFTSIDVTVN